MTIQQLKEEQRKLLNAHYNDAVPLDLMKEEQARLSKEIANAEKALKAAKLSLEKIVRTLNSCLSFLESCDEAYLKASPEVRRQLNQAVFERFLVYTNSPPVATPTKTFRPLLATNALQPKTNKTTKLVTTSKEAEDSADLETMARSWDHHNRDWHQGMPRWVGIIKRREEKDGRDLSPVFSNLGLNKTNLAERVGFELTTVYYRRI